MPVIAMLNQKGGVGKTSTCHHLAGTLAASGRRCLLVDADPQASLTQGHFGPMATAGLDPSTTIASIFAGDSPFPEQVIRPTAISGIDLLPGSIAMNDYNLPRPHTADFESQTCLRSFLSEVRDNYDITLIDCPPNLLGCSWAALVSADGIIVPLQAEDYGAQGLGPVQDSVAMVVSGPNPSLRLLGFLLTMFNPRLSLHKMYETLLLEQYGPGVFTTRVPYATDVKEAIAQRKPISHYKPKGASAKIFKSLADEIFARLADTPGITSSGEAA